MKRNFIFIFFAIAVALLASHSAHSQSKLLIHYWSFNNTLPLSGAGGIVLNAVPPDYTTNPGASVNYVQMPGIPVAADTGIMDNGSGGGSLNVRNGAAAGNYVRTRNESDYMWVTWYFNTKFYKNIVLKYETETSSTKSGQTTQLFDYSLDSGKTWITTNLPITQYNAPTAWALVTIDFSAITGANHSNKFVFRIRYTGNTGNGLGTAATGNNRFDNITLEGDTLIFAPPTPPLATSPTHIAGAWSRNTNVQAAWSASTTGSSLIAGYSFVWDQSRFTTPAANVLTTSLSTSTSLGGGVWYFHVRGVDTNGVGSVTSTYGPIQIDTSGPTTPVVISSVPKLGTWTNNPAITINVGATDALSGVGYYKWKWDSSPTTTTFTDSGNVTTINLTAPAEGNTSMLHVAAVDAVGNVSATYDAGPFMFDFTPPRTPVFTSLSRQPRTWTSGSTVTAKWSAQDFLSGLGAYAIAWDTMPLTAPQVIFYQPATSATSPKLTAGKNWYVHLQVFDNALNASTIIHAGPFYISPNILQVPSIAHASFTNGAWTTSTTDTISWSINPGDTTRLHNLLGYSWVWNHAPNFDPDTVVTSAENSVVTHHADGTWYFHLRAVDSSHNWTAAVHCGPLRIDRTAPTIDVSVDPDQEPNVPMIVSLNISAIDSGSGVRSMQLSNDGTSWTPPMAYSYAVSKWDLTAYGGRTDFGVKTVYVHVFDSVGNEAMTTGSITIKTPVVISGVNDAPQQPSTLALTAYPNPASSTFIVSVKSAGVNMQSASPLKIFDALGREVLSCVNAVQTQSGISSIVIDASSFPAGVYAIRWGAARTLMINIVK